jgi:hypothetical protein
MSTRWLSRTLHMSLALSILGASAQAAVVGCNTDATPSVLAVNNNRGAYCVSDFGWSNTWYSTGQDRTSPIPSTYNQALDLFSGDDAVNLGFDLLLGSEQQTRVTGRGWLSPTLDAGALFPFYTTGSQWGVVEPVHYVAGETAAQSTIRLDLLEFGGSVDVVINTEIFGSGKIRQFYTITNSTDAFLTNLTFTDYFNFHPNGSLIAETQEGTTAFTGNAIVTGGNPTLPSFIGHGRMNLIDANGATLTPTSHDIGCADVLGLDTDCAKTGGPTIPRVEISNFNGLDGPIGRGDFAGALGYDPRVFLGSGESITLGVEKMVLPEPTPLALLGLGMLAFVGSRRWFPGSSDASPATERTALGDRAAAG